MTGNSLGGKAVRGARNRASDAYPNAPWQAGRGDSCNSLRTPILSGGNDREKEAVESGMLSREQTCGPKAVKEPWG